MSTFNDDVYWKLSNKRKFIRNALTTPLLGPVIMFFLIVEPFPQPFNIVISILIIVLGSYFLFSTYRKWVKDEEE
ncbi:hypothetical protein [Alkalibacillus haloalkaliphilus]|uniref:hypothetical protein n=1 Tax=Alkalibacillus haloalkaliphilus TaxID=94136 RepID=UPI000379ABA8|nr:hypothetical protein [Alkalibacillus haloalkaliphilus]